MDTTPERSTGLDELGRAIADVFGRLVTNRASLVRTGLEAGHLLLEAERRVPEGQWCAWLRSVIPPHAMGVENHAEFYMRLAETTPTFDPARMRAAIQRGPGRTFTEKARLVSIDARLKVLLAELRALQAETSKIKLAHPLPGARRR